MELFSFTLTVMRGFMTQRGLPDNPRTARYILKDYVNGRLLYCHAPPGVPQDQYHIPSVAKVCLCTFLVLPRFVKNRRLGIHFGDQCICWW